MDIEGSEASRTNPNESSPPATRALKLGVRECPAARVEKLGEGAGRRARPARPRDVDRRIIKRRNQSPSSRLTSARRTRSGGLPGAGGESTHADAAGHHPAPSITSSGLYT
jgi:hypothetical protein